MKTLCKCAEPADCTDKSNCKLESMGRFVDSYVAAVRRGVKSDDAVKIAHEKEFGKRGC